jgi:hypothetical protein
VMWHFFDYSAAVSKFDGSTNPTTMTGNRPPRSRMAFLL